MFQTSLSSRPTWNFLVKWWTRFTIVWPVFFLYNQLNMIMSDAQPHKTHSPTLITNLRTIGINSILSAHKPETNDIIIRTIYALWQHD